MATGALAHARADIAVSVTGIAGPGGGTPDKPVGTVCFGLARKGAMVRHWRKRFAPDSREKIRENAVRFALERLIGALSPAGADG